MSTYVEAQQNIRNGSHAVVIGGSMAGLLAARILVEHFERVTVVERDRLPQEPETRPGVPQAHHVHVLLTQGQRILEQLFPGIEAEVTAAGAPSVDWVAECTYLNLWGWVSGGSSDLITRTCSRALLEWVVRRRLSNYSNLQFLPTTQVKGLLSDNSNSRVKGVELCGCDDFHTTELAADLIVDASGRNSQQPKWLEEIGYEPPTETVINSFLGYSTQWYERPEGLQADWKALVVAAKPPHDKRGGVIFPIEGNRWQVLVSGIGRDYPPTDEAGFMEFVRSLRTPVIYDALQSAKPLSPVYGYRRTENRWRHYEKLSRLPEGLLAIGDAVCAFNPVYGQGMTVAALSALTLKECLQEQFRYRKGNFTGLTKNFQNQLSKVLQTPWLMATGEDFRWETTSGGHPDKITQLMHRYMDQIMLLSISNPKIYRSFAEVTHLVKPSRTLFAPDILVQVLGTLLNQSRNQEKALRQGVN
ncbi:FAD-dependent oxidoreductase [Mastigocladopsis repens]|uniref:FAD-dependent oxidoreductase n=1 Tax=Mastigocladopsis repens TaxID=221287 RepID=UPI0002D5371B|nr:FAD-dependent monooxygenase [Mastigocladopsis repens]